MKIAFLVLATKSVETFDIFQAWFAGIDCEFFVHVDGKFPTEPFAALAARTDNIRLLSERVDIKWGGFSMMRAEVALIRAARGAGPFDRYVLVSDDTLSLRPATDVASRLASDIEFLSTNAVTDSNLEARYSKYHMYDFIPMSPRFYLAGERGVTSENVVELERLIGAVKQGKKPLPKLYHGSQWWALTHQGMTHFIDVYDGDDELRLSFEYSAIPDEQYIQTVIGNSRFTRKLLPTPMYVDFSTNPKPFAFSGGDDLSAALASNKIFIRKIAREADVIADKIRSHAEQRPG